MVASAAQHACACSSAVQVCGACFLGWGVLSHLAVSPSSTPPPRRIALLHKSYIYGLIPGPGAHVVFPWMRGVLLSTRLPPSQPLRRCDSK